MSNWDESCDLIVVGSGAGSMVAALYARSKGRRALILEKTDLVGGTTARSGGIMWIPNNPFMARDGVEDSYDNANTYLESVIGGQTDAPAATLQRRHAFLTEGPNMVNFLLAQGVELERPSYWPDYYDERPGGSQAGRTVAAKHFNINELGPWKERLRPSYLALPGNMPASIAEMKLLPMVKRSWKSRFMMLRVIGRGVAARLTGKQYAIAGAALQGRMLKACLKAGVELRTQSKVSELIVEDGAVTGVLTVKDGRPWRVRATLGVLVNSGGFALNRTMRERYQPGTSVDWSNAAPGDTGEMIEAMLALGAAQAQLEEFVGYQATLPPDMAKDRMIPGVQGMTASPHCILVDGTGVRYQNEGGSYMAYCQNILKRNQVVPANPSWAIFDSQYVAKYMLAGTMPASSKPQRWYDEGYLKKAGSLAELAQLIGAQPAALEATVARFNGFVANNFDEDFQRGVRAYDNWLGDPLHAPSQTLGSIDRPPYYAIPVVPGDVGTYGGVLTDEHARVLRTDGSVIAGLYATGVATGSVMGRFYPGAGCSIGPGFTFGYVAAQHAVGTLPKS
jgi:3-oxosteroid 1-dehydrogenase